MDSIWSSRQNKSASNDQNEASSLSIAEIIAQTANEFISEQVLPGYTYFPEYSMYYNPQSGYFYDSNSRLFYHPTSQCYYRYNEHLNSYETIQTNTKTEPVEWLKKKSKKRAKDLLQIQESELDQLRVDVLETLFELVDKCAFLAGDFMAGKQERRMKRIENRRAKGIERIFKMPRGAANNGLEEYPDIPEIMTYSTAHSSKKRDCKTLIDFSSESEEDNEAETEELKRWQIEEENSRHAACIRLIETNSSSASPPILHIITISGAKIGFGALADIPLSSPAPSNTPLLLSITYVEDEKQPSYYQAEFFATQIKFNDNLVGIDSPSKIQQLKHEDKICFGSYTLILHLHNGLNTCPGCEPGLFPASQVEEAQVRSKPTSRDAQRRQNNRLIKQQYGLLGQDEEFTQSRVKYIDRAHKRRKEELKDAYKKTVVKRVGGIYANCLAAPQPGTSADSVQLKFQQEKSADTAIEERNSKGLQLLKGMGWKEGQGLGKNKQGIQEPIVSTLKANRAGFGMESAASAKTGKISIQLKSKNQIDKEAILEKTRQRYQQVNQNTNND